MSENLTEMVKDDTATTGPVMFEESDLDLPAEEVQEVQAAETGEIPPPVETIDIMPLSVWFERETEKFENINEVKVAIRGVDADKTLIMAVKTGEAAGEEEEEDPRNLRVFENADAYPVLDLPAKSMEVYNNGFQIQYEYGEILIKCYGVRTSLIATFCQDIAGSPIPYSVLRIKKKDEVVEVPAPPDAEAIAGKIGGTLDGEALQLRYKQISKAVGDMNTVQDAIAWLLDKQLEITDINHHLQIDNVIIETLA